jgi:membrane protein
MNQRLQHYLRVGAYLYNRFIDSECLYRAAALTFTTLLSLVPLVAVCFAILAVFPAFSSFGKAVQEFIIANFVATSGKVIQAYLQEFVQHASQLSGWSLAFLLLAAVLMMFTVEHSFNDIWRVKNKRHFGAALLLYWGVLTVSPILIGVGFVVTSFFATLSPISQIIEQMGLNHIILPLIAFVITTMLFTLLYMAVPNCRVPFRYALVGGVIAALLFEISKQAFAIYLYYIPTYQLLYGALAVVPIFFLWVYLSWVVILLGAVIVHVLMMGDKLKQGRTLDPFTQAISWLKLFWLAQQKGQTLSFQDLVVEGTCRCEVDPEEQLHAFLKANLIQVTDKKTYVLSRDLSNYTLSDLYASLPWKLPSAEQLCCYNLEGIEPLKQKIEETQKTLKASLQVPITALWNG